MSFVFPEPETNERAAALGLDIMPASFGEGFGAAFDDAMVRNPTATLGRMLRRQQFSPSTDEFGNEMPARTPSRMLTAREANDQYGIEGHLKFDADIPEPIAQELKGLKQRELERQDAMRRAQSGIGTSLSAGLVASLLDPLNVASAFVPVVGQARYAALAARYGTTGARAIVGGVEGAVGAALLEPIVLMGARAEQAEYDAMDSLASIAFGTILGSGLHMVGGAALDRMAARREASVIERQIDDLPRADQEALARTAVAQMVEGRPVDVGPVLDTIYYHGTMYDVTPENIRAGASTRGLIYVTKDPALASEFAKGAGYVGTALSERFATFKVLDSDHPGLLDMTAGRVADKSGFARLAENGDLEVYDLPASVNRKLEDPSASLEEKIAVFEESLSEPLTGGRVLPMRVLADKPFNDESSPLPWRDADSRGAEWFRERGFDSVWVDEGRGRVSLAVFDRSSLQSVFDRARDPSNIAARAEENVRYADPEDAVAADTATRRVSEEAGQARPLADEVKAIEEEVKALESLVPADRDPPGASVEEKKARLYAKAFEAAAACSIRKA